MILAVDVHYGSDTASVGGVAFSDWSADREEAVYRSVYPDVAAYVAGQFFRRELPCILHLLGEHGLTPATLVIDGCVYLDGTGKPGLGKHLFDVLGARCAVIGVAKRRFAALPDETEVYRGKSRTPLYVTSAGIPPSEARARIAAMHGPYRIPTLLKRVDQVARMMD